MALVETLIACTIVAIMLGATFQAMSTTLSAATRLLAQRRAVMVAESVVARVGSDIALAPGTIDGNSDGLAWRVEVERFRGDGAGPNDDPALMLVSVSVGSDNRGKASFGLRTLKLAL